jgi:hypothetical protein
MSEKRKSWSGAVAHSLGQPCRNCRNRQHNRMAAADTLSAASAVQADRVPAPAGPADHRSPLSALRRTVKSRFIAR